MFQKEEREFPRMISSSESKESKFFQKAISVFLSALLVVAFIPAVAFADVSDNAGYASSQEDGGYKVNISGSTVIGEDNSGAGEGANTDNSQNNGTDSANNESNSESSSTTDSAEDSVAVQSQGGQGQSEDVMSSWRFANGQLETVYADEDNGIEMYSSRAGNGSPVAKGIDVSSWQGNIDWNTVKNSGQVDFVIIRCGWGNNDSSQNDAYWLRNASECKRLGIPFGVYIYSYACNTSYAVSEADHVLAQLNAAGLSPSQVAYPIYLDLEQQSKSNNRPCGIDNWNNEVLLSNGDLANIAQAFCNRIASAGYTPGIYANLNWWNKYLTSSVFDNYERWVAQYNSSCWYEGNYSLWQYASDGTVPGISGYVDMNYDYGVGALSIKTDNQSGMANKKTNISVHNTKGNGCKYKFVWKKGNWEEWGIIQELSDSNSATFVPSSAGSYTLIVDVVFPAGYTTSIEKEYEVVDYWSLSSVTTSVTSSDFSFNQAIRLSAVIDGNASILKYKFVWQKDNWAKWGVAQDFSSSSTCSWTPQESGNYTIYCDVADSAGNESTSTCKVNLTENWNIGSVSVGTDNRIVGSPIELKANVSGNTGALKYKFVWQKDNWAKWGVAQDFSSSSTCSWTPQESGNYTIYCDVADSAGNESTSTCKVSLRSK